MTDGQTLLTEYAEHGSESAFRDLVRQYVDLVYSTALRKLGGDTHSAQDVTQTVFLHLAKKARTLPRGVMLGGWLHQAACNVAATVNRAEWRRHLRESEAVRMNTLQNDSTDYLEQIAPVLDDAIAMLPTDDRTAVLLRFFEKCDFRAVGEALGSSEDAARMRVNRALEKLQSLLKQRGVAIPVAALGATLAAEAVLSAPVGLAATVAGSALAGVGAAGGLAFGIFKIMAITKLKLGVISAVIIGALATSLLVQHQSLARLRDDNRSLQQQLENLHGAQAQLADANVDKEDQEKLRRNQSELLRLRGEVTTLRRQSQNRARQTGPGNQAAPTPADQSETSLIRLQANVRTQMGSGQTLVTGGWSSEPGKRMFLFATPQISSEDANVIDVGTKVVEIPETSLAGLGLVAFKAQTTESSLKRVLQPDETENLFRVLRKLEGATFTEGRITTADGRGATMSILDEQMIGGVKQSLGPTIDIVPVLSGDNHGIDLTLQAAINKLAPKAQ